MFDLTNGRVFSLEFLSVARSRTTFLHRSSATAETVCPFIMTEIERKCAFQKLKHGWTLLLHKNSPLDSKVALSTFTQKKVTIQIDALEKTFWIVQSISGETRNSHLLSESHNQSCFDFAQIPHLLSPFPERKFQVSPPVKWSLSKFY